MAGHPPNGAPGPGLKLCNQSYQRDLVCEIWSQWGNFSPGGPAISRSRRNLYSFGGRVERAIREV